MAVVDTVDLLRGSIGHLVIVFWRTRIGLNMRASFFCAEVDTFTQDGAVWVRARDEHGISKVCAPVSDIGGIRVLNG